MPQHIWHLHEWGAAATARCGHFQDREIYMAQQWWRPIDSGWWSAVNPICPGRN